MNAKEYLDQIRKIDSKLSIYEAEIKALRYQRENTLRGYNFDGLPHGKKISDPTGEAAAELADLLADLEYKELKARSELWRRRAEVIETISKVRDPNCNTVLYMRYVELETIEQIAVTMNYSYRQIQRINSKGLRIVEKLINKQG